MLQVLFLCFLSVLISASPRLAEAQQAGKVPRIGFLVASSASFYSSRIEAFRQGLRELGYVEGKNIAIEYRFAEGKEDRLRELAAELVRLKVDIIIAAASAGAAQGRNKERSRLSWLHPPTQSRVGLLPAWHGRGETLPG